MTEPLHERFEQLYPELRKLARSRLRGERSPVSTGTLVHELYLRMRGTEGLGLATREAFFAYAARTMRTLLVDEARERLAKKRSAHLVSMTEGLEVGDVGGGSPEQLVALGEVLEQLERIDPRLARIAEMRALMGMSVAEVGLTMGLSEVTIRRDWQRIRAFLGEALGLIA